MQYLQRFGCGLLGALFLCLTACQKTDRAIPVPALSGDAFADEWYAQSEERTEEPRAADDVAEMQRTVFVYVCGAVQEPQVVELPEGSRVLDALAAAGGLQADADRNAVNLAEVISDGQKLYFPTEGEEIVPDQTVSVQTGKVNINTADAAALCTLPGIGPSRADAILTYRKQNGSFDTITDIMKVPGIKEGAFQKIQDLISVK